MHIKIAHLQNKKQLHRWCELEASTFFDKPPLVRACSSYLVRQT